MSTGKDRTAGLANMNVELRIRNCYPYLSAGQATVGECASGERYAHLPAVRASPLAAQALEIGLNAEQMARSGRDVEIG